MNLLGWELLNYNSCRKFVCLDTVHYIDITDDEVEFTRKDLTMKKILSFLTLIVLMMSCVCTDYIGKTYPSTTHVDIFLSEADIKQEYEVMGEITAESDDMMFTSAEKMQEKIVEKAKQKGADGIILSSLEKKTTGEETTNTAETNYSKDRVKSKEKSETSVKERKELRAKLIKYKK